MENQCFLQTKKILCNSIRNFSTRLNNWTNHFFV
jgi:hypothetical protein